MISCKPILQRPALLFILFFSFCFSVSLAQDGKALFQSKCASCHTVFDRMTGPALGGLTTRGPWVDKEEIYKWVHNPPGYMQTNDYTKALKNEYGSEMTPFPALSTADIDAIVNYIETTFKAGKPKPGGGEGTGSTSTATSNQNAIIFGVISLILAIIAFILMQVNSNLKKMSDDAEGILRPEPVPFYRNKVYIAMVSVVFFIIAGFFVTKAAIGLQRQKHYQPQQPIFYSHKVHAGLNQINCLHCHGNAWESKSAAIPSVNVCMNCHKTINEYKGPLLEDEAGNHINGTAEIQKLYEYAGFDPKKPNAWDASKAKPISWVRIHNLPDHVYFNHSQHIKAGNVQCQTCHGEIQEMHEVKQFSELSMGWCINCHRQTKVNFNYTDSTGNKYYSIYEKFHNDLKSGRMDSVTVKDIGGLECQKCHY